MKWMLQLFMLLLVFSVSAYGQPRVPFSHGERLQQERQDGPAKILEQGLNGVIHFLQRPGGIDEKHLMVFLEQQVAPHFNFSYMAKWSSGRAWRQMGKQQREQLVNRLKGEFLGVMVQRLAGYGGQGARVVGAHRTGENEMTASVIVQNPQGYPARLGFRFQRSDGAWKVIDVSANGSSALMHYRRQFRQMRSPRHPQFMPARMR